MTEPALEKFAESLGGGAASATTILSRMTRLTLASNRIRLVEADHAAAPAELFAPGVDLCAGLIPLTGDVFGQALLVFPIAAAEELSRALTSTANVNSPPGAAIEEAISIFGNTALAAITRDFKLSIYPAPPHILQCRAHEAWNAFVGPLNQAEPRSTVAAVEIASPDRKIVGSFLLALRRDSMEEVRWKSVGNVDKRIEVKMGDMRSARQPGILKVTSLGSCVAVILYDPTGKLGAVAHVMLPNAGTAELGRERPGKYADTAVEALLQLFPAGARARLQVYMIGGASMSGLAGSVIGTKIGERNSQVVREHLVKAGLLRVAAQTGGSSGRTVEFDTSTGEVRIQNSAGAARVIPPAVSAPAPSLAPKKGPGLGFKPRPSS